jgi:hypothetical protein
VPGQLSSDAISVDHRGWTVAAGLLESTSICYLEGNGEDITLVLTTVFGQWARHRIACVFEYSRYASPCRLAQARSAALLSEKSAP